MAPELLEPPELTYPPDASGSAQVELELTVDADGTVSASEVTRSGGAAFDAAALDAAARLRFSPATRDGVAITARIPFQFTFEPPPPPSPPASPPVSPPTEAAPLASRPPAPELIGSTKIEVRGAPPLQEPTRHTLELDEVRTVPGTGGDVLRAVETMPGVARPAWGQGLLIVRGSAPDDSLVFVDGTEIPYVYHLGDGTSIVPGDLLERLDFYPGNFGAEYGRGMGGVVDVGLRSPRRDRLGGLVQLDVIDARAMLEAPVGEDTAVLVAARRSHLDAWIGSVLDGGGTSLQTAPVYWDAQAVVEHALSARTRARLSLFGADDRVRLAVDAPSDSDPVGGQIGGYTRFLRTQLRLETELTPRARIVHTLSWGLNDASQEFSGDAFGWLIHQGALRSGLRTELARWLTLDAGIDAMVARYDVDITFRPYPETNGVPGPYFARPSRSVRTVATSWRPGAYAGFQLTPLPGLELMPSLRADYVDDTGETTLDPRFNVRWDVVRAPRRTTLKGGVGLYHQPPRPEQALPPFGTEGIESNRALHASVGAEQALAEGLELSLEGFYKRLRHLVVATADETRVLGARFDNSGAGRVVGAEVLLRYAPYGGPLSGWLAYTLSRSERREGATRGYSLFDWDQTHVLSAVANLELGAGWQLGGRFRYVTGSPYTPYFGGVVDLDAGAYAPRAPREPNGARLADFHQLDLRIEKQWVFEAWKLGAYLEVRNVYNRRSAEGVVYSYDYAEHEPIEGLPILPVLGVRGEL